MFWRTRGFLAGLAAAGFLGSLAMADVSGYLGAWLNPDKNSGLLGSWIGPDSGDSGIARLVATPAGAGHIRLHLYGRCRPECDWGSQLGHNHSAAPDSAEVVSISADFVTGEGVKHLTLRPGPGHSLRYEVVTDFNERAGRHDYETGGSLVAATAPAPAAAGTPVPSAAAPVAAAAPAAPRELAEDCVAINPADVYMAPANRGYRVNDYAHTIVDFGANKLAAAKAVRVLEYYGFDEQCYVSRPHPKMVYWRTGGRIPAAAMPGEDCDEVHPAAVTVNGGQVMDGARVLIDYKDDAASAAQAASVIRIYRLNRQCFVARPDDKMIYWLSR